VVPDLVPFGDDTPRHLREAFDVATDHEKSPSKIMRREHVKNPLRIF
jgi:hypothetical protein